MMLISLASALYLAAGFFIWKQPQAQAPARWLLPVALVLHGVALSLTLFHGNTIVLGLGEAISLFAWQAALLLWVLSWREPVLILGIAIYPLTAIAALATHHWAGSTAPAPISSWKAPIHILLSLFSAGLLTIAAVNAVLLAVQERLLHRHRLTQLARALPPLQTMERLLFQLVGIGFVLLSLTLLSGLWFIHDWMAQHLAHKTVLSITAWLIFGILLWGRLRFGWRGRTAIRWALSGYAMLIIAYFGSKLILEEILGKHWT